MDDTISKIQWLHKLRKAEIEQIIKFFPSDKNSKILEVGGGDCSRIRRHRNYEGRLGIHRLNRPAVDRDRGTIPSDHEEGC